MHGHLAELEDEPHGMAQAIGVVEERVEFVGGERAVLLVRHDGLGEQVLAQALLAELLQLRRRHLAEVGRLVLVACAQMFAICSRHSPASP